MADNKKLKTEKITFPRRGEIYLVRFDPTVGREIRKTRPAVIIQNDVSNQYSSLTIVAAVSSKFSNPPFPREIIIEPKESGLPARSAVVLNQIRSIDKTRIIKPLGRLNADVMREVDRAINISLGLTEI